MAHSNNLITFLRHYGPISASDNMYDELIQSEIKRHGINPAIHIDPAYLDAVRLNFESITPRNVILTGTAGDGKTYHCRRIWENFCGDSERWKAGDKVVSLVLPASGKRLVIVKDLSELTQIEKHTIIENLSSAIAGDNINDIFLIAANDGQLLASWREWTETHEEDVKDNFKIVENMLVEERETDDNLILNLYNLSRIDASTHFKKLVNIIVEHPQWSQCEGCELLDKNGISSCPIRINRERLRGGEEDSVFIRRLGALMKLARANRMHLPIRDLLLLCVNIILGDRQGRQILLTCLTAKNRAVNKDYRLTNPYANVFGMNLPERQRQQYQVFTTLEAFGIGRETDNKFDNLLIYGAYNRSDHYNKYVANDDFYGSNAYSFHLRNYLEGEHDNITKFLRALGPTATTIVFLTSPR